MARQQMLMICGRNCGETMETTPGGQKSKRGISDVEGAEKIKNNRRWLTTYNNDI